MLAVVKRHRTKKTLFEIKGDIPPDVMRYLKNKFGQDIMVDEKGEKLDNIFDTRWYQETSNSITPGEAMKIYRENLGLSQATLGKKIGKLTRQKISDMENGKRGISKEVAKELSRLFAVPVDRFI